MTRGSLARTPSRPRGRAKGRKDNRDNGYAELPSWIRRHPVISVLAACAVVAALAYPVYTFATSSPCGPGLSATGSPWTCVGLDLDSGPMRSADPLNDLEKMIANRNSKTSGEFATIVVLEDMTPGAATDSLQFQQVRHNVEGAITAASRANGTSVAGSQQPQIRLLLANFGSEADSWQQAVAAIEKAQQDQHIVAVTGIGQSLDNTRAAAAALSDDGITTVGADATADNMNKDLSNRQIKDFFRVAPTNSDEVAIAVNYIEKNLPHRSTMLVEDQNTDDSYAQTLGAAFRKRFSSFSYTEPFRSPSKPLADMTRQAYMTGQFANMHSDICAERPDLIYFAGRGADLESFLRALSTGGACPLPKLTVMTGDDASNMVGTPLPAGGPAVTVLYTPLTAANQWSGSPAGSGDAAQMAAEEAANYQDFATAFTAGNGFPAGDLADGPAIMEHDAVLTAAAAVRDDPAAIANPGTVATAMLGLHCRHSVPGASGFIAIGGDGNPIDKVMPVLQINRAGTVSERESPEGPVGQINYLSGTCKTART